MPFIPDSLRLLIISYYFPPLNLVSSFRLGAFAKYLPTHGIRPTVLTLRWQALPGPDIDLAGAYAWHEPGASDVTEDLHGSRVIRLPRVRTHCQRFIDRTLRLPGLSSCIALLANFGGFFDLELLYAHFAFKRFLRKHLSIAHYDAVIATMAPPEHLRLGAWMNQHTGTPFIADYRDTYDNRIMSTTFRPSWRERLGIDLKRHYHRRWMRRCSLLVSVSRPLLRMLSQELRVGNSVEVRNGYDPDLLEPQTDMIDRGYFRLIYSGQIYPHQILSPFIEAMEFFLARLTSEERGQVRLSFYGIADLTHAANLNKHFSGLATVMTARISQNELHRALSQSCILLIFDYGQTGVYSGKLMEYVGMHRNILMIPSDKGVIAELVQNGRLGLATGDPAAAADFLFARFREWQASGHPMFTGDADVIAAASMSMQTALLAHAVRQLVASSSQAGPGTGKNASTGHRSPR